MQSPLRIHVIAFQNPYPPTYGGVIDTYYRIKELHDAGVYVTLHTYCYGERQHATTELTQIADEIFYYKRKTGWLSQLSTLPYIVYSRRDKELLHNLCKDSSPILFEGLHTTYFLSHPALHNRIKIVRAHNIEHNYYRALAHAPVNFLKRAFYLIESIKLKHYERQLHRANVILALNTTEQQHFKAKFPQADVIFSPVFYDDSTLPVSADESYILYQGNLSVAENSTAAQWIINNIAQKLPNLKFVIAGYAPDKTLQAITDKFDNVQLIVSPSKQEMDALINHAKVHLLITFQPTGVKLKLINVLHRKGIVIANKTMLDGSGLDACCIVADSPEEIIDAINQVYSKEVSPINLPSLYCPQNNISNIINYLSSHHKRI